MKIGILHLSDFHLKNNSNSLSKKVDKIIDCLNVYSNVDDWIIAFTGDLADSANENEYKVAGKIVSRLISNIKSKTGKYVNFISVPGNHDLSLLSDSRTNDDIVDYYKNKQIDDKLNDELNSMQKYFDWTRIKHKNDYEKIVKNYFYKFPKYNIQFNLINTAPFSTLKKDNKELHYFPKNFINSLKKQKDIALNITLMHHSIEWFSWESKNILEKEIFNNCEIVLQGHDHYSKEQNVTVKNNLNTYFFTANEMNFDDMFFEDSFNIVIIDSQDNHLMSFTEKWNCKEQMYESNILLDKSTIKYKSDLFYPNSDYIKKIKCDDLNLNNNFMNYFVFPKLSHEKNNDYGNEEIIKNYSDFTKLLEDKRILMIKGNQASGKTTLLKYVYLSLLSEKIPLLLTTKSFNKKVNGNTFIKRVFQDQYGDDPVLYEKYSQLDREYKVLLIDDYDDFIIKNNNGDFQGILNENFGYIIISKKDIKKDIEVDVRNKILKIDSNYELVIKPFFLEKRNQLVQLICNNNGVNDQCQINEINKIIDSLVGSNPDMFSLNPGFLIKYINYFKDGRQYNYTKGEAVFSKIFQNDLENLIIQVNGKDNLEEILIIFGEIAGNMFNNETEIISISDIKELVIRYNKDYDTNIKVKDIIETAECINLLNCDDEYNYFFVDKNYFAYFIAKYLLQLLQIDNNNEGIKYAMENICFEINSTIIMFILYLSNGVNTVLNMVNLVENVLDEVPALDLDNFNIKFINKQVIGKIEAPSNEDSQKIKKKEEQLEEKRYSKITLETKGLFDYDKSLINEKEYILKRAFIYTEMICKSLPVFYPVMKNKKVLVDARVCHQLHIKHL